MRVMGMRACVRACLCVASTDNDDDDDDKDVSQSHLLRRPSPRQCARTSVFGIADVVRFEIKQMIIYHLRHHR